MRLIVANMAIFLILAVRAATAGTSSCAAAASGRCNVCSSCCRGWLDSPAMNAVRCLLVH